MADTPKRANAAQMAARNIKAAKRRPAPVRSTGAPQSMSFGGGTESGGGSLFASSGSFDFSVQNLPQIQFAPTPYDKYSIIGQESAKVDDPRGNELGEEEARRKKPFQSGTNPSNAPVQSNIFGGQNSNPLTNLFGGQNSNLSNAPMQSNIFTNLSSNSQPNIFGGQNLNQQSDVLGGQKTNLQSSIFDSKQGFAFNTVNGQGQNPLSFQTTSQSASPSFGGFKTVQTQDNPPASNPFNLNAVPAQPVFPSPTINFGSGTSEDQPAAKMFNYNKASDQSANSVFTFGTSAPLVQNQPTNNSLFPQVTQNSRPGIFTSTSATQASISNNSEASVKPASSVFKFGSSAPLAQNESTTKSLFPPVTQKSGPGIFAPTPATQASVNNDSQASVQPAKSIFNFGSSTSLAQNQPAKNSLFPPATEAPVSNDSQASVQPAKSIFNFGSSATLTQNQPAKNSLFSPATEAPVSSDSQASVQPAKSIFNFGYSAPLAQDQPVKNSLFPTATEAPVSSDSQASVQPAKSIFNFGSSAPLAQDQPVKNSLFPTATEAPISNNNQASVQSTNSIFNFGSSAPLAQDQPVKNSLFPTATESPISNNNQASVQSTNSIFNFGSSAPLAQNQPASNSLFPSGTQTSAPKNIFGTAPSNPLFGQAFQQSASMSKISSDSDTPVSTSSNLFGSQQESKTAAKPSSLFGGQIQQLAKTTPTTTDMFGNSKTNSPAPSSATEIASIPSTLFGGQNQQHPAKISSTNDLFSNSDTNLLLSSPANPSDTTTKSPPSAATTTITDELSTNSNALTNGNGTTQLDLESLYAEMAGASSITDEQLLPLVPSRFNESQKKEFMAAYRLRSLNKAVENFFASVPLGTGLGNLLRFYNEKKIEILEHASIVIPGLKRRSRDGEDEDNQSPKKRSRQVAPPKADFLLQSSTPVPKRKSSGDREEDQENVSPSKRSRPDEASNSNLFQQEQTHTQIASIATPSTNGKKKAQVHSTKDDYEREEQEGRSIKTPKVFSLAPPSSQNQGFIATPSSKSKRKAEVQLTKDDHEREEQEGRQIKSLKVDSDTNGSNASNIFKGIVNSTDNASSGKKIAPLPGRSQAKNDAPRPNPFEGLFVPKSPIKTGAPQSSKPASKATSTNTSTPMLGTTGTNQSSSSSASLVSKPDADKPAQTGPPKFGTVLSKVDFFAQFKQKAKESNAVNEHNIMVKAMEEELDSEDDEETVEQWKVTWIAKRKAQLEEFEKISQNGKGFIPAAKVTESGSASSFVSEPSSAAPSGSEVAQPATTSKSLSEQPIQSSGDSSRNSTPGPFGSSTGSVLDGYTPGQPVTFGAGNIFGHLSDADSGVDRAPVEEDTASEDNGEEDSENKDPNYVPGDNDNGSGPETPAEYTGAGIASSKKVKSNIFGSAPMGSGSVVGSLPGTTSPVGSLFDRITGDSAAGSGGSPSGTSTPSRSLFDRITRDDNGNPIRHAPTQANPTLSTPSLFGNISGSVAKQPTFNLFGSSPAKPPALAAPATSSLGFNFGSPAASLQPSAIPSTGTSRATSPGNTTDGASVDEDRDAEKDEQISLTAGGPGEEEEEILYEVRSKALQFISPKLDAPSTWKSKGVGILRVLMHNETGRTRVVLRGDPSGVVILNKSLLAGIDYAADKKTVRFGAAADEGSGIETYLLQVKTAELAEELANVLQQNKPA